MQDLAPIGAAGTLAQVSLRTTPIYRLFSLTLVIASFLLIYGTPLLRGATDEGGMALRIGSHGLCLLMIWHAVWAVAWQLDYDSIGLSCRIRGLPGEARMWRALVAIEPDGPLATRFHFADGLVMRVPTAITGRAGMMETAQSWLHHGCAPLRG